MCEIEESNMWPNLNFVYVIFVYIFGSFCCLVFYVSVFSRILFISHKFMFKFDQKYVFVIWNMLKLEINRNKMHCILNPSLNHSTILYLPKYFIHKQNICIVCPDNDIYIQIEAYTKFEVYLYFKIVQFAWSYLFYL